MDDAPGLAALPRSIPFTHSRDTAPADWMQGILWVILASAEDTGGRYSLLHQTLPERSGPPPHKHAWSDEHFTIFDGEITFLVGDEISVGRKNDFVWVPRNTRHAFRVESATAILLNGYMPAGLERSVAEMGIPALTRTIPPPGPSAPPTMTPSLMRRYGMDAVPGPNPLDLPAS